MKQTKDNVKHPALKSGETTSKNSFLYFCLTFKGYEFYKRGKKRDKWEAYQVFAHMDFDELRYRLLFHVWDWTIKESSWPELQKTI